MNMTQQTAGTNQNWDPKEPTFPTQHIIHEVGRYIPNPYLTADQTLRRIMAQHNGDAHKAVRGLGRIIARLRRFRAAFPDSKSLPMLEPYEALADQAFVQLKLIRAGKC